MTSERKLINREKHTLDFDGEKLTKLIKELQYLSDTYGPTAFINKEAEPYGDGDYLVLVVPEPENDDEYALRIATESRMQKNRDAYDLETFNRLKKKFESS